MELINEFNLYFVEILERFYIINEEVSLNELLEIVVKKWDYLYSMNGIELFYKLVD